MRALLLISGLAEGGAERVAVSLLERWHREGEPVPCCTLTRRLDAGPALALERAGVERLDLGARRLVDLGALRRYGRLLKERRIELVHAHGQDAAILAGLRRLAGGPRLVVTRHVIEEPARGLRESLRAGLALRALRACDAVVAVSQAAADRLSELASLRSGRPCVIPNGVDLDAFLEPGVLTRGQALRRELRRGEESLLLCPAVLREGKGHELLIAAFSQARSRGASARLLLAGDGPRRAQIEEAARPLGDHVLMLGARDDVPCLLAACDAVVLASESEALPTALIEAAAAGRPAVATRVGGTEEVVVDGQTGLLVGEADAEAFAAALLRLCLEPGLGERLGRAGRERAQRLFGLETQARATREHWRRVLRS